MSGAYSVVPPSGKSTSPAPRLMRAVVKYTYQAEDSNQLSLEQVGDIITIHSQDSEDWWDGSHNGQRGYLPAKYVELLAYEIPSYESNSSAAYENEPVGLKRQKSNLQLMQSSSSTGLDSVSMYLSPSAAQSFSSPLLHDVDDSSGLSGVAGSSSSRPHSPHAFWSANGSGLGGASSSDFDDSSDSSRSIGLGQGSAFFAVSGKNIFSLWSSSLGKLSGWVAIVSGALTLMMGLYNHEYFRDTYSYVGVYSMCLGALTILYETFEGRMRRAPLRLPFRSLGYLLFTAPMLVAYPTRVAGLLYFIVALVNLVATCRGESVTTRPRRLDHPPEGAAEMIAGVGAGHGGGNANSSSSSASSLTDFAAASIFPASFATYFLDRRILHRGRRWAMLLVFATWNVLVSTLIAWWHVRSGTEEWNVWWLTGRTVAWLLLCNLVLFFFTAMRYSARALYDAAERSRVPATRTCSNSLARSLLTFFPPDPHHAVLFYHTLISALLMLFSVVHGLAHTLSFMVQPEQTLKTYTYLVYTSGALMLIIMILVYSVSRNEIRLSSPQLFRIVHACYVPFIVLLMLHAPQGFSVAAILVLVLPMTLWIVDKLYNYYSTRRLALPVLSLSFIRPNTIRLECSTRLAPGLAARKWTEGSFAYVNFPSLSAQWLPLSISSAPQAGPHSMLTAGHAVSQSARRLQPLREAGEEEEKALAEGTAFTFHLHVDSASLSSPTARWLEYFQSFGPLGASHFLLDEPGHRRAVSLGRVWNSEGQRIVRIDGPHPTPVQHLTKYHTCMLIAPSSGVSALASAIRSVLQHRWKAHVAVAGGLGDSRLQLGTPGKLSTTPDALCVYWLLKWSEIDDYRWMIQTIKDCEDELFALRDVSSSSGLSDAYLRSKHFELHVFVVGTPSESVVGGHGLSPAVHEESFFGPATVSQQAVAGGVGRGAPFTCLQLYRALKNPSSNVQQFSSISVHRGSPNWGAQFTSVSHRAAGQADIGVIYTAGPLAAHITPCSAAALREQGMLEVPTAAAIAANSRTAEQLKVNCAHHSAQSGKRWIYHSDVDVQ